MARFSLCPMEWCFGQLVLGPVQLWRASWNKLARLLFCPSNFLDYRCLYPLITNLSVSKIGFSWCMAIHLLRFCTSEHIDNLWIGKFLVIVCGFVCLQGNRRVLETDEWLRVKGCEEVYALGDCSTIDQRKIMVSKLAWLSLLITLG